MESVAIVNCCLPSLHGKFLGPPQGPLYVATDLHNRGVAVKIYDTAKDMLATDFTPEQLGDYLIQIPERIIGISLWDSVAPKTLLAAQYVKEKEPEKILITGGPSASTIGPELIKIFPWIDFNVSGEGERNFYNLLMWLEGNSRNDNLLSSNVIGRYQGEIIRGRTTHPTVKAEEIPIPNYTLVNRSRYNKAEIVTTRGCPFTCEFCSVNNAWGQRTRFRTINHIKKEISSIFADSKYECIHVLDDTFGISKRKMKEFCNNFEENYPDKKWSCYFRVEDMDRYTIDFMAKSGCLGLYIGVETGREELLSNFGKGLKRTEIIERIRYASSQMNVTASFIWGLPEEGFEGFLNTLDFIDKTLEFENVFVNLYQLSPLSGTVVKTRMGGKIIFDPEMVSEFIYPHYIAPLTWEERELIQHNPDLFSAFYHEMGDEFEEKYNIVQQFIGNQLTEKEVIQ